MTLVETLMALAIVALVSAALFQSVFYWLRMTGRVVNAADGAIERIIAQRQFQAVVGGLIFKWPESPGEPFRGDPSGFIGQTRTPLEAGAPRLAPVEIRYVDTVSPAAIEYRSDVEAWEMARLDLSGARFSYLGADGRWRDAWPPDETPDPGPHGDSILFPPPQLPEAIRVQFNDGADAWIARVESTPYVPVRNRDVQ